MIGGVVFDFDGTILDTETPVYESWRDTFVDLGAEPISFLDWVASIGLSGRHFDPVDLLAERLGSSVDRETVEEARRDRRNAAIDALSLREGIEAWMDEAATMDVPIAVASSSPNSWVAGNLDRRKLRHRFSFLACAGDNHPDGGIVPGKPDPTSFRLACTAMGVQTSRAIAVEDSPHGVAAARAAGLFTVAVPGPMTAHMDFSAADLVLTSLDEISLTDMGDHVSGM